MSEKKSLFFVESFSGSRQQRRFTLELFREVDGSYRIIQSRFNTDLQVLDEEKHTLATSKSELQKMNLGNSRLIKQLRRSEWWESKE